MTDTKNSFEQEPHPFVTDAVAAAKDNGGHTEIPVGLASESKPPVGPAPENEPPVTLYNTRLNVKKIIATTGAIAVAAGALAFVGDRGLSAAEEEGRGYAKQAEQYSFERNDPARIHLNQAPVQNPNIRDNTQ